MPATNSKPRNVMGNVKKNFELFSSQHDITLNKLL